MKKIKFFLLIVVAICITVGCHQQPKAKYVFYFIGDGMGLGQRTAAEMYLSAMDEQIGQKTLLMDSLPIQGFASTYSANSYVTCSAAAGTALATGTKTKNGMLGMDSDTAILQTIAEKAKAQGKAIGIITTVMLNHATPGAFYAHQSNRDQFEDIKNWMLKSDFDYFAGGQIYIKEHEKMQNVPAELKEAGYFVATNREEMNQMVPEQNKWVLIGDDLDSTNSSIKFVMDRKENAIGLVDMLQKAIELLTPKDQGFFIMIEGGKIDFAAHVNDGASVVHEVLELDDAVRVALDFYKKHPKETLIVVTADHETGGLTMGNRTMKYKMFPEKLAEQKHTVNYLYYNNDTLLSQLKAEEDLYSFVQSMSFSHPLSFSGKDSLDIFKAYQKFVETHNSEKLPDAAIKILNREVGFGWTTGKHTGTPVPVSAIGVGAEQFSGMYDNTDIPKRIEKIMQLK
ncbi:MAG: alkaline phosphatase [Bacteroidales bacterium]|nr:alkaline phosphatase [Bacteroidales bacterium]